jgi:hypothetical protein
MANRSRIKSKQKVDIVPCGLDKFKGFNKKTVEMYKIDKLMCIKNLDDFTLKGDFYSGKFRYLEIRMFRCENSTSPASV